MDAAERIVELMKAMKEHELDEVLDFAKFLIAKRKQKDAFAVFEKHVGLWSGKFSREDAYADRGILR